MDDLTAKLDSFGKFTTWDSLRVNCRLSPKEALQTLLHQQEAFDVMFEEASVTGPHDLIRQAGGFLQHRVGCALPDGTPRLLRVWGLPISVRGTAKAERACQTFFDEMVLRVTNDSAEEGDP